MLERILIAGAGGQGIILTGRLLAAVALKTVPHITFMPSYGAEVRGGVSNCQLILSSDEIASPVVDEFDTLVILNAASAERFLPRLAPGGMAIVNSSLCDVAAAAGIHAVPATGIADRLGDIRSANFVMLGALLKRKPVVTPADMDAGIRALMAERGAKVVERIILAFRNGMQ